MTGIPGEYTTDTEAAALRVFTALLHYFTADELRELLALWENVDEAGHGEVTLRLAGDVKFIRWGGEKKLGRKVKKHIVTDDIS